VSRTFIVLILMLAGSAAGQVIDDSVVVVPPHPTASDSITFLLFDREATCCAVYHYDSLARFVGDTAVFLSYRWDYGTCLCPATGEWVSFKCGPLHAGTYGVYNSGQIYCLVPCDCTMIYLPAKIGEVSVLGPTGTAGPERAPAAGARYGTGCSVRRYDMHGALVDEQRPGCRAVGMYFVKDNGSQAVWRRSPLR
jgi:hypothetical protein